MIWALPAAVVLVAAGALFFMARRVAAEAAALRRTMAGFAELRSPIAELRDEARAVSARLPEISVRARPGATPTP